ncbi:MAG: DUF401 family protein [Kiritimatiellae bacterium]|nr:DUF401 family protein [Kiritimatiellia bacterium]
MPAVAKILLVFAGMLSLSRLRIPLGLAILVGGAALYAWAGHTPLEVVQALGAALWAWDFWLFMLIVALIMGIGRFMTEERNAAALISAAQSWGGRRGREYGVMAVPALIGLVPMPAGALFSAPLVRQIADTRDKRGPWQAALNYWFRHVWEYWWPLYPGVIMAMSVFEMETWQFIAAQLVFSPIAIGVGYLVLVRPRRGDLALRGGRHGGDRRRAALVLAPLALVVACVLLLPFALSPLFPGMQAQTRRLLAMAIGLGAGLGQVAVLEGGGTGRRLLRGVFTPHSAKVLVTLAGVLVFKSMLTEADLIPQAGRELLAWGIPISCAVAVLPCLAGLVTGIALGFSGTAFPLVVGLMKADPGGLTPMATLVLAFGFGFMGMMLSPVHLCFVVTKDYFAAPMCRMYRYLLPCVGVILAAVLAVHGLFRALGW